MEHRIVIAGTVQEATDWIRKQSNPSKYIIAHSVIPLSDIKNPSGVFIGSWIERTDMSAIFIKLLLSVEQGTLKHKVIREQRDKWDMYHSNKVHI